MRDVFSRIYVYRYIFFLLLIYYLGAQLFLSWYGLSISISLDYSKIEMFLDFLLMMLLILVFIRTLWIAITSRSKNGFVSVLIVRDLVEIFRKYFIELIVFLLIFVLVISVYSSFKAQYSVINPFHWDVKLHKLDYYLFFGHEPWKVLRPLSDSVLFLLDKCYAIWVLLMVIVFMVHGFVQDKLMRLRFALAFCLCWIILGSIGAYLFSSAGPCYFSQVTGFAGESNPYQPLINYLHSNANHDLLALKIQGYLWELYSERKFDVGVGISAMPSLHVALCTLFMLAGFTKNKWLGSLGLFYLLIIWIGSVILGWHYFVDGLVSIPATIAIWCFAHWFTKKTVKC